MAAPALPYNHKTSSSLLTGGGVSGTLETRLCLTSSPGMREKLGVPALPQSNGLLDLERQQELDSQQLPWRSLCNEAHNARKQALHPEASLVLAAVDAGQLELFSPERGQAGNPHCPRTSVASARSRRRFLSALRSSAHVPKKQLYMLSKNPTRLKARPSIQSWSSCRIYW